MKKTFWFGIMAGVLVGTLPATAAPYTFISGYNVLDEANSPGIGTNLAATAGFERGFGVDVANGIIYLARGFASTQDGRTNTLAGAFDAIVTTNGFNGANYTDTGLIAADANNSAVFFSVGEIVADPAKNRILFQGQGTNASDFLSVIYSAPTRSLGGAPAGGNPGALNPVLTNLLTIPNDLTNANGTLRSGTPRGFAARTINGVTTIALAYGNHAESWRDDASVGAPQFPWRRVWATLRAPIQNSVSLRLGSGDTRLNGIDLDDEGNCYFTVEFTSPPRIWRVAANVANTAPNPWSLDFDDRAAGGTNSGSNALITPVIPRLPAPAVTIDGTNSFVSPQDVTFFRTDGRKGLFVSSVVVLPVKRTQIRSIARLVLDEPGADPSGFPYQGAAVVDAFGSGAATGCQDTILQTMRLKSSSPTNGLTQPLGGTTDLLYTQVNTTTNPTVIYFQAFLTDTNKGQTIPTAAIASAAIPPLPPAPSLTTLTPGSGTNNGGDTVTLMGSNFVSGAIVKFGGTLAASVNFSNASLLVVTTPPHAGGTVTVTVENPDGQIGALTNSFTYLAPQLFLITSITLLQGDSLRLTWNAVSNAVYQVQASNDLFPTNWTALGVVTAATTSASFTNTGVSLAFQRYYRVARLP